MAQSDLFDQAVAVVLALEGVSSNDPADAGGQTKWGISRANNTDIPQAIWDSFTIDDAKAVYRNKYWSPARCTEMPWPWALGVFDGQVNQGNVIGLAQLALGLRQVDSIVGGLTLSAMASATPDLFDEFLALRALRYTHASGFARFGGGWLKRIACIARSAAIVPTMT